MRLFLEMGTGCGARRRRMPPQPKGRPGHQILGRYCPNLSPEERELAHERLRGLACALIRIHKRLAEEELTPEARLRPRIR